MSVSCDRASLEQSGKCFNCLSKSEKKIFEIWLWAQLLKQLTGTDLTNVDTLSRTVACLKCEPDFMLDSFETAIARDAAVTAGAIADQTINQLRAAIKCWMCLDPKTVRAAHTYLLCQLAKQLVA